MAGKQYLSPEQVGRRLGLEATLVKNLLENRLIPAIQLGDTWLVPEAELNSFLAAEFEKQNAIQHAIADATDPKGSVRSSRSESGRRRQSRSVVVVFRGQEFEEPSYTAAVIRVIKELAASDPTFLRRMAAERRGRRRYVAPDKSELYFDRPDLSQRYAAPIGEGWWLGTNYSREELEKILRVASKLSGLSFGLDILIRPAEHRTKIDRARALAFVGIGRDTKNDVARHHDEYLAQALEHART